MNNLCIFYGYLRYVNIKALKQYFEKKVYEIVSPSCNRIKQHLNSNIVF